GNTELRRGARCPGHLGVQVRIRHGVPLCTTDGNAAGGGIARTGYRVSGNYYGGWRDSNQSFLGGHKGRSARGSGDGGSWEGPLPGDHAPARRGPGGSGATAPRRDLGAGGAPPPAVVAARLRRTARGLRAA